MTYLHTVELAVGLVRNKLSLMLEQTAVAGSIAPGADNDVIFIQPDFEAGYATDSHCFWLLD